MSGQLTIPVRLLRLPPAFDEKDPPLLHDFKCWPPYFGFILAGIKTFEIRKNTRVLREGDYLQLSEYNPKDSNLNKYTGRILIARIGYILAPDIDNNFGLEPGYCVMSLLPVTGRLIREVKGGWREHFWKGDICPACGEKLFFDAGQPQTMEDPEQPAAVYCPGCQSDYPIDWDRHTD